MPHGLGSTGLEAGGLDAFYPNKEINQKQEKTGTRKHGPQQERSEEIPRIKVKVQTG